MSMASVNENFNNKNSPRNRARRLAQAEAAAASLEAMSAGGKVEEKVPPPSSIDNTEDLAAFLDKMEEKGTRVFVFQLIGVDPPICLWVTRLA
jgi:hypothetical protein